MARRRRRFEIRLDRRGARAAAALFGVAVAVLTMGCVFYAAREPARPQPPAASGTSASAGRAIDRLNSITGWVPSWIDEAATVREAAAAGMHGVLLFHGTIKPDGSVTLEDPRGLAAGVEAAHQAGLETWLTVTNHGKDLGGALRGVPAHAESVLAAWRASGCMHLDLDYESMGLSQVLLFEALVSRLADALPAGAKLSLTLQPADSALRPDQVSVYRRLLAQPRVACVRLMAYDYHWRNSLPGALYPMPAFKRLIEAYSEHRHKLVFCLPLYGYDWPRPDDTTIPQAQVVMLRDVGKLRARGARAAWMSEEAELALEYHDNGRRWVAAPSLRAISARVSVLLESGIPAVSFWHLGCAELAPVARACTSPRAAHPDAFHGEETAAWREWQEPFKRRVCRVHTAAPGETLESIAKAYSVERAAVYRFNPELTNDGLAGRTVYIPR